MTETPAVGKQVHQEMASALRDHLRGDADMGPSSICFQRLTLQFLLD